MRFFQCLFTREHAELVNHRFVKVQGSWEHVYA